MPCGFESHLSHQISPNPIWDLEIFLFAREMGLERPLRKHAGGMFLGRGRVPPNQDAFRGNVDRFGICSIPKSVGMTHFFDKSYKNTRTKKSRYPIGYLDFLLLRLGSKKGGTSPQTDVKRSTGTFWGLWESPSRSGCIWINNMSDTRKCWHNCV